MNSFSRALSAAAVFLIAAAAPAVAQTSAAQKIAYVDSRKILEAAPGSPKADSAFKVELASFQAEVKKMQDTFQKKVEDFNKVKPTLAAAEVDKRTQALGVMQNEYSQKTQELEQQADQRRGELMQPVIDQIKLVLEDESRFVELVRAVADFARRSGTRRLALRIQGEFQSAYQRVIALGGHVRWTDLRMSLADHLEQRPARGLVLSNWEI